MSAYPMLSFAQPVFLLLALAIPPLVWWWLHQAGRPALRFSDTRWLSSLPSGRNWQILWLGAGLRAVAVLLLVIALAGPRWPDLRTRITTEGIAIMLLLDVSGSMAERDFTWQGEPISRLDALKQVLGLFVSGGIGPRGEHLNGRPSDLIGVVTFATRPETLCPLTLSHSALLRLLDAERPRNIPTESETNIGDAIVWGLHRLEAAGPRRKVMLLISDGEHNVPPPAMKPRQAAQLAGNRDVPIYVIDARGTSRTTAPQEGAASVASQNGEAVLAAIARITRGRFFHAEDTDALLSACKGFDRLERQEITSYHYRRYHESYPWFALGSLVLLLTVQVLDLTLWLRIP